MNRRDFLARSASLAAATWLGSKAGALALEPLPAKVAAHDTITLGKTGIKTSRLAMGTGTHGTGHRSNQTSLGVDGLSNLLRHDYDQGLRLFDLARRRLDRAREGAALIAEQLGFQQVLGDRRAVDGDEFARPARAEVVDGAGEQFLAGAGRAEQHDGNVGARDALDSARNF